MADHCSHMQVKLAPRGCVLTPGADAGFVERLDAFASSAAEPKSRVDVLADGLLLGCSFPLQSIRDDAACQRLLSALSLGTVYWRTSAVSGKGLPAETKLFAVTGPAMHYRFKEYMSGTNSYFQQISSRLNTQVRADPPAPNPTLTSQIAAPAVHTPARKPGAWPRCCRCSSKDLERHSRIGAWTGMPGRRSPGALGRTAGTLVSD